MKITRREFVAKSTMSAAAVLATGSIVGCTENASEEDAPENEAANETSEQTSSDASSSSCTSTRLPNVYFTPDITPAGLMAIFEAIGRKPSGKVGVKVSTGEAGGNNYLKPKLIGNLVKSLDGTILECNTAYGGSRSNTASHLKVAKDHGFMEIADVDIMDAAGEMTLPVKGGTHLKKKLRR